MTTNYTPSQLAEGTIRTASARLAGLYPFHAAVLRQFVPTLSPGVGTMGVTASRGGVLLLFNPDFVLALPAAELGGVLLHEVHHVVFEHLLADPANYPDRWARVVAEEVTVNEFVKEPLPAGGIHLGLFPGLPEMESTDERYRRLARVVNRLPIDLSCSAAVPAEGAIIVVDNHTVWETARENQKAAQKAVAAAVQQAVLESGGVPPALAAAVRALGAGTLPGSDVYAVRGDKAGRLDWRRLLRRYVGEVLAPRPAFDRPPRRCPELVGVLPGVRRLATSASVVAVIDTSGSIGDDVLEQIDGELRRMSRTHTVHVVECDCAIHRVSRRASRLGTVIGRGGTDFRPPLEPHFLRKLRAGIVVYFTDGDGPAPDRAPPVPVVWCLVPGGQTPATWGRVIPMHPAASANDDDL